MALPLSGYIFKVPTAEKPLFSGESLLKLSKLTRNKDTNKIVVSALTPNGRKVSGSFHDDSLMTMFMKNPKTAPQQFEKAQTRDIARRTIRVPGTHSKNIGRIIIMPEGTTTANVKARKTRMIAEVKAAKTAAKTAAKIEKTRRAEAVKLKKIQDKKKRENELRQQKKNAIARLPPPPPKKLNESLIISQLVQRAVETLRSKLTKSNYPEEYVLDLSELKDDFPEDMFNYFNNPKFKNFNSLLSSLYIKKPVGNKFKFQNPQGIGLVDLEVISSLNIDKDDIQIESAKSDDNNIIDQKLAFELVDVSNFNFSNYEGAEFSFTKAKEREIIDAMKDKYLSKLRSRMSKQLLEKEVFYVKKSQDVYNVLSDAFYVKKRLNVLSKKELDVLKKTLKIKSENTNEVKKKILEIAPDRVRAAEKKRAATTVTKKRTQRPRKAQLKPIGGRKQKTRAPRLARTTKEFAARGVLLNNNNNNNNNITTSLRLNSADVSKISLGNLTDSMSVPVPNVSSAEVPNLWTKKLGGTILKYSMLIAMKQTLEDKIKDTTELMQFIEPYKCVNEFIWKQHAAMLNDKSPVENYETTLGCMSEIYSMKHMFKEQKAIIRFASGLTRTKDLYTGDEPESFLSQIMYLSGPQLRTVGKLSNEWTNKYGVEKIDKRRNFETEKGVQGLINKDGKTGPAYEKTTFNIYEDIMGYKKGEIKFKGGRTLKPPPKKIRDGSRLEDNPEGHASHMLTSAYKRGYCMTASEYTENDCMESDDIIANARLGKDFWERRLRNFGLIDDLKEKEMDDLNDIKIQNCPMADCEKHCKRNGMRYCGGINSLVKRMLNYEIPKAEKGSNRGGINVNFDKVIVDLASEAARIKKLLADRKKAQPKAKTVKELEKNVQNLSREVNTMQNQLNKRKREHPFMIPPQAHALKVAQKELRQAELTLTKANKKKELGKDIFEEGMQKRIQNMIDNPAQAFGLLTTIEKEKVLESSNFDNKLTISNGDKSKATTTTTLALIQKGAGEIVPVEYKGKLDNAVVVSMPGGGLQVISQNVLKKTIENNPLSILPLEAGDIISDVGGLRAVTKGPKEAILEDVFNIRNKNYIDRISSSFKEIVKDLNSSHTVVHDRIERRKNRRSEEFTRKLKFSALKFLNESINKEDEFLLKYMYQDLVFKMESTRQFIKKKINHRKLQLEKEDDPTRVEQLMPSKPCDYFTILYNHFIGFNVSHGRRTNEYCNSENIKKLYTIFKTSKNIQYNLQNMFSSDRKLREVYQYAADDYFHKGMINVSSCASKFLLLGRSRHVAINPSILDKIRQRKIQKEINKYTPLISSVRSEVNDIKKKINHRKLQLEKEDDPTRVEQLTKILADAQDDLDVQTRSLLLLKKKHNRWVKLKRGVSKGKVTHIYLDRDNKWKRNDATDGKLKRLPNVTNTTAKEPLSVTSRKGNTMFFKQATLLANYIGYLVAPENVPKEKKPKKGKVRKPTQSERIRHMKALGMSLTASPGLVAYEKARKDKRKAQREATKAARSAP
uniref:Uncharacterized protein n=1 Tax=viral metagenome TaxID=1070528 RepID=A0A6C0IZK2_9ZZZZ